MTTPIPRAIVTAFLDAFTSRDVERIAPYLDKDVIWTINGPVDLLHYCGVRQGSAAVLDLIGRQTPAMFHIRRFTPEFMLVDGDRASVLSRMSAVRRSDNRNISYRTAQFLRFANEKLVEFLAVIDSFDAVEQVLGHPIDMQNPNTIVDDDVIAV